MARPERNNPFKPERPDNSLNAVALVGSVLAALSFFAIGMLKDFGIIPVIFFSLVVGGMAWYFLKGFLSRRKR